MSDSKIVYVNGHFVREEEAMISVFDRGFLFADGVYEVSSVIGGKLIDNEAHLARLQRSLGELQMEAPLPLADIVTVQRDLIKKNKLEEGIIYLQVTRGSADRDFNFPADVKPSLVMFVQHKALLNNALAKTGIKVISVDDIRWKRRDIKTVGLLAQSLAKEEAKEAGADDAWMVEDGFVTEGTASNAYIVSQENEIITRHLGNEILSGITRKAVLSIAIKMGLKVIEKPFTVAEIISAREAFSTGAAAFVLPVISIDGNKINDGHPGPVAKSLREAYVNFAVETALE